MEDAHKQRAVEVHAEQAGEFEERYHALASDPYASTFTYGRKKVEELIERVLATLPPSGKALDVGCGTGFNVRRLRDRGFDVTGLEPAEEMRTRAQADNPDCTIVDGDIEHLPFDDASFDLVISIEVIRYLADPHKGVAEIFRVLRPGGVAVITAAPLFSLNGYALLNQVTGRLKIPTFTKVKHSFVTARGGEDLLRSAGFTSVEAHGLFLGPWHAVGRLAPKILPSLLRALEPVDDRVSNLPLLRDLSNHLVLVGHK